MIKKIYIKLILIFTVIFFAGNVTAFVIAYNTTEKNLLGGLADMLSGVTADSKAVYEQGGSKAETIEKLYSSGMIAVKFYKTTAELKKAYDLTDEELLSAENKPVIMVVRAVDKHGKKLPICIVKSGKQYIVAVITPKGLLLDIRVLTFRVSVLSLLIGSLLMLIASRIIVKPVRKLSAATEKIAKGDFNIRIHNNRRDEIGQLIKNFNIMAGELAGMEMLRNNFISDISHEFKTPLTSIEGYTKLLRDCKNDTERNEYIDIITEETKRLSALSGNILLLNRIENENIALAKSAFRLDEQIRQVILFHENKWSNKQIELQLDLEETVYEGNEQLLYQVWLNLFDNAVKFSGTKGLIEVRLKKKDSKTIFTITDYGSGMTQEEQKRIFEKFFTGDRSRSTEGNGLGLSIVKRILDMHSGTIEVISRPGEFTKLTVNL
jgi:signal transduction histidine kinase